MKHEPGFTGEWNRLRIRPEAVRRGFRRVAERGMQLCFLAALALACSCASTITADRGWRPTRVERRRAIRVARREAEESERASPDALTRVRAKAQAHVRRDGRRMLAVLFFDPVVYPRWRWITNVHDDGSGAFFVIQVDPETWSVFTEDMSIRSDE